MRIHREGHAFLVKIGWGLLALNLLTAILKPTWVKGILTLSLGLGGFLTAFFRYPRRYPPTFENIVVSPADGTIVGIEKVYENEYFQAELLRVSIFLSVFNVHANWIPLAGQVIYSRYSAGDYLVAFHPKASELNERSTVVIERPDGVRILVRQIAGLLARRIVTYPQMWQMVRAGDELGFIKFGSRVDVFLPLDAQICVQLYDQVQGGQSILAELH